MKILVSRPDKIGDVTLSLHGIKQLKKHLPDAKIYMHIAPYTQELIKNVKFIDGVFTSDQELKGQKFDTIIDLIAKYQTAKTLRSARAKTRIGNSARWHTFFYNKRRYIRRSKALLNEAEYNWQLLSLADRYLRHTCLEESLDANDFKSIIPYTEDQNYIVLMPSVTASAISWNLENWLELSRTLASQNPDKKILFLVGPAEKEIEERITLEASDISNCGVRKFGSFPEMLGFLKSADYYIGTSTGITHLASAMGTDGIALYPEKLSMHPRRWLPFKTEMKVVSLTAEPTAGDIAECYAKNQVPEKFNPLKREEVSAFIICCNEEKSIERALSSVSWCDEIIVVDSGSTDNTIELCKKYTDKIYHRDWTGNRDQKQFALDKCTKKWILNIDADEEVSLDLKAHILKILINSKYAAKGYQVCRLIYYLDRWWDRGGWYPEYRLRFFQKEFVTWGGRDPHEKALMKGRTRKLSGFIYHYTYDDIQDQVKSLHKHAQMMAQSLAADGKKGRIFNIVFNPLFRFFKFYILKKGFLEGFPGIIVAVHESYYTFLKYLLLWEKTSQKN